MVETVKENTKEKVTSIKEHKRLLEKKKSHEFGYISPRVTGKYLE